MSARDRSFLTRQITFSTGRRSFAARTAPGAPPAPGRPDATCSDGPSRLAPLWPVRTYWYAVIPKLARPPAVEDDGRVLAEAAAGDEAAFGSLVGRYQGMVFSLAHRFLRDRAAAEDLAQDVFLELYRNLPTLRSTAHMRFWLRRVACHRCIDRIRKTASQPEASLDDVSEPAVAPVARDVLLDARLRDLVGQLPPRPRLVMLLRYQEDLEPSEIAAVLDMPVNTVKSHLRRSVSVLREQLSARTLHEV